MLVLETGQEKCAKQIKTMLWICEIVRFYFQKFKHLVNSMTF